VKWEFLLIIKVIVYSQLLFRHTITYRNSDIF
jgi:hypothetical protein